ncbi:interleukin-6 receptor subunit alpha [Thalassophryne amazonica]|uniref:interleukin-6 receptor subunit alpha n=1 Tax=Thalassophryne amazonica TaxID=390379 RepID=UPI0014711CF2|nr:interleukin-6 receptor subunit alpha [Thalassophryne amazonica]
MRLFLSFLCALCATPLRGIFEGTCPKKDPGPGVLVLHPGSKLVLTCRGQVKVDGVVVSIITDNSNAGRRESSSDANQSHVNTVNNNGFLANKRSVEEAVSERYHTVMGEKSATRSQDQVVGQSGQHDAGLKVSPTAQAFQPTSRGSALKGDSVWEAGEMADDGDNEEEEDEEEGYNRVTRGVRMRPQWMWNGTVVKKGDRRGLLLEESGFTLSLPSVTVEHVGRYTCHHRGKTFSLKLVVAEPTENPTLFCYKRSPSSKIRCEWIPKNPTTVRTQCYLFHTKSPSQTFFHSPCSYSAQRSRCWCVLEHHEDDRRKHHMAYLCATSIAGNRTSNLLHFTPLDILKPDPPSNVAVQQVEGQDKWIRVSWNFPVSWNYQDNYYVLIYEISYKPNITSLPEQNDTIKQIRSYTIRDALPGVDYVIKLRTKDEHDGVWSNWSLPLYARSWTDKRSVVVLSDDVTTTMYPLDGDDFGSGMDEYVFQATESPNNAAVVSYHHMWILASLILLMVIFLACAFRHREGVMSKLHKLTVIMQCGNSSQTPVSVPAAPEGQTLMILDPPCYKEHPPNDAEEGEEENEEDERAEYTGEAMHFDNTSYYLVQRV